MELIRKAAERHLKKDVPDFHIGDTVKVSVKIIEGEKERIQAFTGVVIARRGSGMGEMFTVRRIVNNEGVERIFPIHNPRVAGIEVIRGGQVRRAKLYFLRDRVGKKTRLKDLKVAVPGAEAAADEGAEGADEQADMQHHAESAKGEAKGKQG